MDKKSRILLIILSLAVLVSVAATYYRYLIKQDYYFRLQTECDPVAENCFVYECDPAADVECPENSEERISYYKYIEKKVYNLRECGPDDENCSSPVCDGDQSCREFLCEEASLSEGESCLLSK